MRRAGEMNPVDFVLKNLRGHWNHYLALACRRDDLAARGLDLEDINAAMAKVDTIIGENEQLLKRAEYAEAHAHTAWRDQPWAKR